MHYGAFELQLFLTFSFLGSNVTLVIGSLAYYLRELFISLIFVLFQRKPPSPQKVICVSVHSFQYEAEIFP